MWKKLGVVLVSLVATFSVVYAMNRDMSAASSYNAGGNVTGRINMGIVDNSGTTLTGSNIGLQKGDKIATEIKNPKDNTNMSWQLLNLHNNYTMYSLPLGTVSSPITAWYTMANQSIGDYSVYNDDNSTTAGWQNISGVGVYNALYVNSNLHPLVGAFNTELKTHLSTSSDNSIVNPIDMGIMQAYYTNDIRNASFDSIGQMTKVPDLYGKSAFVDGAYRKEGNTPTEPGIEKLAIKDIAFSSDYQAFDPYYTSSSPYVCRYNHSNGSVVFARNTCGKTGNLRAVRLSMYLNVSEAVFAVSKGNKSGLATVNEPVLKSGYTSIYDETKTDGDMKVRLLDTKLKADLNAINDASGNPLTQIQPNKVLHLNVDAPSYNNSTVSVIVLDNSNKFVYYQPLEKAVGLKNYAFDTTGFPVGNYKIAVVNEIYDDSSVAPSYSSLVSDAIPLSIVQSLFLTYSPTPQASLSTYEYKKNVAAGEKVGEIAFANGVGATTLTLLAHPSAPSGHANDYKNFEIGATATSPADIKIKASGAPDIVNGSLKAGDYYFRIEGIDANGDPNPAAFQDVKLTVDKTLPTITLSNTTTKYMKIGSAKFTDTVTTTNKDSLTTKDVSYILTGGLSGILSSSTSSSNPLTYDLSIVGSHGGTGLPATYDLNASIKETNNYLAASTASPRNIIAYKGLSALAWSPSKGSYSSSDVTSGSIVGTLIASDGVGPFTYEVAKVGDSGYDPVKGANNSSFIISNTPVAAGTKVDVKTASNLAIGTYNMQFKVTDASGDSFYTDASITVIAKAQVAVEFKDVPNGTIITTLGQKVKFDATTAKLIAEGGSTTKAIEYDFAPSSMQPSGVTNASDYATIHKTSGLISPKKTGTIKVQAKRPGDTSYGDAIVYMDLSIEQAPQQVDFNNTSSPIEIELGSSALVDGKGKVISTGATGVGDITYSSSNSAVATVDDSGNVKGVATGTITLTITLNDSSGTNYNADYETVTSPKTINIYTGMSVSWVEKTPYLLAESNNAKDGVGTINVSDNQGAVTYAISSASHANNADASFFQVVGSGTSANLQIKTPIKAADQASHGGTFKVQVDVSDSKGTRTIDISIQIGEATNTIYFTDAGVQVASLTKVFGENANTFNLTSYSINSGNATYSVNPSDTSGTLSVLGTGATTINKVGTAKVNVVIGSGSGYAGDTISMNVDVTQGNQAIAFKDTTTQSRQFNVGTTFNEPAELKESSVNTVSTRVITYVSNSPSVCSIDADGAVTMLTKGVCDIDAKNTDSDWKSVTTNKRIMLYDKMSATWTPVAPNLKAETNKVGDTLGTIAVNDNQGAVTYAISIAKVSQNADASFFQIIGSGTSATLQLKLPITALDQASRSGMFKVQVEVTDSIGTETVDLVIQIDEATNSVYFSDGVNKITNLTKVFGENLNTFQLTSYSKNSGTATYADDLSGVLSVVGNGTTTINKIGISTVSVAIGAGSGYAGDTATMVVTVTQGNQVIAFKDTTTLNQQFVAGSTFSDPAELVETSANTVSSRIVTYTSNTPTVCSVDAVGTITMLTKGICDIDASNSDANWKKVMSNKKINLYDGMGVSFAHTPNLEAGTVNTAANAPSGSLTVSGGSGIKTYAISSNTGVDNKEASLFKVGSSGVVSFTKAIKASDLVGKYDPVKKVYVLHVQIDTTDALSNTVTTNAVVELKGEKLNAVFDTGGVGNIVEEYGLGKTFLVTLSSNAGGGIPTYQLKNDPSMPTDVLQSVDPSGLITILHANEPATNSNPVMVEAIIPANNGYDEETIEVEVEIVKAAQPNFAFKNSVIKLGYEAQIRPVFQGQLTTGLIVLTSGNNALASIVDGTDITANSTDGSVTITAIAPGDRDYKSAAATATVNVSSAPAYSLVLSVPSATYGDTGLAATIVMNGATGANQIQTWSSSDPSIADIDASGNITIKKAGSVTISCTQTSTGEPSVTATVIMVINPKAIIVSIHDDSKYVGENLPSFSAEIPTADLVGTDIIGQPNFSCKDGTTLVESETAPGVYDITGAYPTGSYSDYTITVKKGSLTVKQDTSLTNWYHLEGDTSKTKLDANKWHNQDVNVVLDPAVESAGSYNEISLNKILWDVKLSKVSSEGEHSESVNFRINASDTNHPYALSTPQVTTIRIDKTKPVIKSITGTVTNKDAISTLLNKLTFGAYFKQGTKASIISEDILPKENVKVSGVKSIAYEIFEVDRNTGKIKPTAIVSGDLTPNASGISEVTMNDVGLYRVCAIPTDHAENQGTISCSDLNVKNIGVDVDKDGDLDNLDPDNDGCPDIDIVLKDKEDKFFKLNTDRDGDNLPDLNIDGNGDGKADINIDTDGDGNPDVNLLIISKEIWKPTFCVTSQSDEYCTVKDLKASINIDLDGDHIPDINIDTNGDMKADYNITKTGEEKPYLNIGIAHTKWEPNSDFSIDKFVYDSDKNCKPILNIDSDHDGLPDLNIDLDDDGLPDLNIDLDLDNIPDVDIDSNGDGKADINLDPDKTGKPIKNIIVIKEWKPEHNVNGNVPYDTMVIDLKNELEDKDVTVEKPGGGFLPNYAIKVDNVTDSIEQSEKDKIDEYVKDGIEIKDIFNVKMYEGLTQVEPDGIIKVKIPLDAKYQSAKNLKIIVEQKDGTYKEVEVTIENGYIVYETDYLGTISILADILEEETPIEETPIDKTPPIQIPAPSVKGNYSNNIGGAMTGDSTDLASVCFMLSMSGIIGFLVVVKIRKKDEKEM